MDPVSAFVSEIKGQIRRSRTGTAKGRVTAVSGGEVSFTIGADPTPMKGRWVGASSPDVGEVITYLDEGNGYPIVFGPTGRDALGTLYEWTPYTPTWWADTTFPALGNGSITGRYARASQWVMVEIHVKAGAGTTFGAGPMHFDLPFASYNNGDTHEISGHLSDAGGNWYPLKALINSNTNILTPFHHAVTGTKVILNFLTATDPVTLGDADAIHLVGIYRTA